MGKKIIVLHETGHQSHYRGLLYLLKKNDLQVQFNEFSLVRHTAKSIVRGKFKLFGKQLMNFWILIQLAFSRDRKVILGVAPFDYRLWVLLFVLRNHNIYYHTSWPHWHEAGSYPHKLFFSSRLLKVWERFLQDISKKIFAVTKQTKNSLITDRSVSPKKIDVVYHAFDPHIFYPDDNKTAGKQLHFVFVGRLEASKGLKLIMDQFQKSGSKHKISIVGDGSLKSEVISFCHNNDNANYYGYIKEARQLAEIYRNSDYLLLPSLRQKQWEELFGIVIIEAMACGVVPVTTDHAGPKEVIDHGTNGFIYKESEYAVELSNLLNSDSDTDLARLRKNTIVRARDFSTESISAKWVAILND